MTGPWLHRPTAAEDVNNLRPLRGALPRVIDILLARLVGICANSLTEVALHVLLTVNVNGRAFVEGNVGSCSR